MCFRTVAYVVVACVSLFAANGINLRNAPTELVENAGGFLLDANFQANQLEILKKETSILVPRLNAGGRTSRCVLALGVLLKNERGLVAGTLSPA